MCGRQFLFKDEIMSKLGDWLRPSTPLAVLAPHPDDELLGCARLMQRAHTIMCPLVIIWLTDGGASHGLLAADEREALVQRRRAEAAAGLQSLGVSPAATYHLGHPDGELERHAEQAREAVGRICQNHHVGVLAVTDVCDNHPDHRAAFAIATGLGIDLQVLRYPVSTRFDGEAYSPPDAAIRLETWRGDAKRAALLEHRSQMEMTAVCPMTVATIDRFCADAEYFMPVERRAS